jgi:hypothetical protein
MSRYKIGTWEDGSYKYVYLKRWKHMPEKHKRTALIRRKLWIAQSYKHGNN